MSLRKVGEMEVMVIETGPKMLTKNQMTATGGSETRPVDKVRGISSIYLILS